MRINYVLGFALIVLITACQSGSKKQAVQKSPSINVPHKGSVLAGDFPEPSVVRDDVAFWSTSATSNWAPPFTIQRSEDLVNWSLEGNVFAKKPPWTDGNFKSPEILQFGDTYFVYFSAKNKLNGRQCLGVGTASSPQGPYKDHGPLLCQELGSVDPFVIADEKGERFLFWKEDANTQKRSTPIWMQKLSSDGTKLVGKPTTTISNDAGWESQVVEAPFVTKHQDFYYMFYSGNSCCTRECNYQVGVARARALAGPWEKNPANPILKGNENWKCPGHGSIVKDTQGRDIFLYQAYHSADFTFVGRQAMADLVEWGTDGWPTINGGQGPSSHSSFLGSELKNAEHIFTDEFNGTSLLPGWQWPQAEEPKFKLEQGRLTIHSVGGHNDPIKAVLGRSTTTGDYTATAVLITEGSSSSSLAGISAFGSGQNAIGVSYGGGKIRLWNKKEGQLATIGVWDAPQSQTIYLRLTAREGHLLTFEISADGKTWSKVGTEQDGTHLPPWDLGVRVALTAGGPTGSFATFESLKIAPILSEK